MTEIASDRAHADLALAVYLEPHAERRKVLLLGEANGALADSFDRLASRLEIIDPETREPSRGEVPELPFDDGEFDLVVVGDANALPEPKPRAVRELRRVLARGGLLAVVNPLSARRKRRGAPSHVWLEKLLSSEFRDVRVLGQQPVSVYAVGELARSRGEEFTVDSSLVDGRAREPERLLGLASEGRLNAEPRLWVELPLVERADDAAPAGLVDELRRAEDETREALHRESDLLRKLESERKARLDAEHLAERARVFERKLLAAEADYDDAVARVRYFESVSSERDAAAQHDRERREHAERDLSAARDHARALESERDAARSDLEALQRELAEHEQRLSELGRELRAVDDDKKHHQQVARDLVEELRRLEHDKSAAVEHDARVAELEAERDRAVQRALDAEVAREAAQMRVDELRAELSERERPPRQVRREERKPAIDLGAIERDKREAEAREGKLEVALQALRDRERELETALSAREERERALQAAVDQLERRESQLVETVERLERRERERADTSDRQLEEKIETYRERERELANAYEEARERERELARELARREATASSAPAAPVQHELERELLRGETRGLRFRLEESERALEMLRGASDRREAHDVIDELRLRLAQAEANLHAMRETRMDSLAPSNFAESDFERLRSLEVDLVAERRRVTELSRELDEADRFAEVHAEDAERLTALEGELESARDRLDDLADELRSVDDELRTTRNELRGVHEELGRARGDAQRAAEDASAKVEAAERREAERDDARAALAEARSILSQLATRLGADENDPPSIFQALVARDDSRESDQLQQLRSELAQRDQRIEQLERWLNEAREPRNMPQRSDTPEY